MIGLRSAFIKVPEQTHERNLFRYSARRNVNENWKLPPPLPFFRRLFTFCHTGKITQLPNSQFQDHQDPYLSNPYTVEANADHASPVSARHSTTRTHSSCSAFCAPSGAGHQKDCDRKPVEWLPYNGGNCALHSFPLRPSSVLAVDRPSPV